MKIVQSRKSYHIIRLVCAGDENIGVEIVQNFEMSFWPFHPCLVA